MKQKVHHGEMIALVGSYSAREHSHISIIRSILTFILLLGLILNFFAVTASAEGLVPDSISIVSVTPDHVQSYSYPITFTVVVNYSLGSSEQGIIYLGFNTAKPDRYTIYDEVVVGAGVGTATLTTTITPVGWGTSYAPKGNLGNFIDTMLGYSFKAYVNLSPYPHDESWDPYCTDSQQIDYGVPTTVMELDSLLQTTTATEYNSKMALFMMQVANAAYEDEKPIDEAFTELGFARDDIRREYTEKPRFDWDSAKFAIGRKFVESGEQVVMIAIRGTDGTLLNASPDWISNFYMGSAYSEKAWHDGFKAAAYVVFNYLKDDYFDGSLPNKNIKYMLTGHSRGAAIANLLSVLLMEEGISRDCIYDYNFACPDVARDLGTAWNPDGKYDNIFNIGNCSDPISQLPGTVGDTIPLALNFFVNKDKWYGRVIDALNETSIEQVYTSWGKYGRSYWFSDNWGDAAELLPDFPSHAQNYYLGYLSKGLPLSEMKTWAETKSLILGGFIENPVHVITGLFFCPVDVNFTDQDGNVLVSVKDGEISYVASDSCAAVILTDGDKKVIRVQSNVPIKVEAVGTDDGSMSMVLLESDVLGEEYTEGKAYENVALHSGKKISVEINPEQQIEDVHAYTVNEAGSIEAEIHEDGSETSNDKKAGGLLANFGGGDSGDDGTGKTGTPTNSLSDSSTGKHNFIKGKWPFIVGGIALVACVALIVLKVISNKRKRTQEQLFGPLQGGGAGVSKRAQDSSYDIRNADEIICKCGASNPSWATNCLVCGAKLKRPKKF